jgi:hypothetical protein
LGNYCERLASCTSRLGISFAYGAGPDERRRRRRNEEEEESFLFVSLAHWELECVLYMISREI